MIEFIRNWVLEIVGMIIFTTLLQIILPNSTMKKYVNMIIGLLIILVIVNPFIKIINKNIDIEKMVFASIFEKSQIIERESNEDFVQLQQEQVVNLYKGKVIKEIGDLIEKSTNYSVYKVELEMIDDMDDKEFGNIKLMQLGINQTEENKINRIKVEDINPIHVISDNKENKDSKILIECDEIKDLINEKYGLSRDNIQIYFNTK